MKTGESELSSFLFGSVLTRDRVHSESPFDQQTLPDLHTILKVLCEVPPSDHLQKTFGVVGSESIEGDIHLRDGSLIVLGITESGSLKDIHLEHAVVHSQL